MSMLTKKTTTRATAGLSTARRSKQRPASVVLPLSTGPIDHPSGSRQTSLIFEVLLGAAACLSLVGVIQTAEQSEEPAEIPTSSADAPPPGVFVQTD